MSNRQNRRSSISGQFAPRLIEMIESPAFRALSLSARRVLSRVEIELAHHGGKDTGYLPITYDDFEEYGIHRHSISPAIREVEALGFVRVTERGRGGNAEFRRPNLFGLTYRPSKDVVADGTHALLRHTRWELALREPKCRPSARHNPPAKAEASPDSKGRSWRRPHIGCRATRALIGPALQVLAGIADAAPEFKKIWAAGGNAELR